MTAPRLVITIDTEGDNAWARPRVATTRNAEYVPRFQERPAQKFHELETAQFQQLRTISE